MSPVVPPLNWPVAARWTARPRRTVCAGDGTATAANGAEGSLPSGHHQRRGAVAGCLTVLAGDEVA